MEPKAPRLIDIERFDFPLTPAVAKKWGEWVMTIPEDVRVSTHFMQVHVDHAMRGFRMDEEGAESITTDVRKRMKPRYSYSR